MTPPTPNRARARLGILLAALAVLASAPAPADARPLPPARLYGALLQDGVPLEAGFPSFDGVLVEARPAGDADGAVLAACVLGADPTLGSWYRLDIPLDTDGPTTDGAPVDLWVGGSLAASGVVTESGRGMRLDLAATPDQPPALTPVPDLIVAEGEALTYTATAADPDGDTITYSALGLPPGAGLDAETGLLTWAPGFEDAGVWQPVLRATARGLTDSTTFTLTVLDTPRPPVFDPLSPNPASLAEGETLTLTVSAVDPDGDDLSYGASGLPPGATLDPSTGSFTWTPGFDAEGVWLISFTATAGGQTATQALTIHVLGVDRPPVVVAPAWTTAEGSPLAAQVEASDPDGDALSYAAQGLPTGAVVDPSTGVVAFTPGFDQAGVYPVTATVAARGETATALGTLTVADTDRPPALELPGSQEVSIGDTLAFTVVAQDPDGDAVSLSAVDLPVGATFDGSTGRFTFAPTAAQVGETFAPTFSATARDLSASGVVAITVGSHRPPTLAPVGALRARSIDTLAFRLRGSDPLGETLHYTTEDPLPPGVRLDPSTGLVRVDGARLPDAGISVTFIAQAGEREATRVATLRPAPLLPGLDDARLGALIACQSPVAVAAPAAGEVWVLCPDRTDVPLARIRGEDGAWGLAVAIGDVDGDLAPDVIVGAPAARDGRGVVRLYTGRRLILGATLSPADATLLTVGDTPGDRMGAAVSLLLDGNLPRVAAGAPGHMLGAGQVAVLTAAARHGAILGIQRQWLGCDVTDAGCGASLVAGDTDGDLRDDLVVGAPDGDAGATLVFRAGAAEPTGGPWLRITGERPGDTFGATAAVLPGEALLVGGPDAGDGDGAAWVFVAAGLGGGGALSAWDADAVLTGGAGDGLGASAAFADLQQDGDVEVVLGAPMAAAGSGEARVWSLDGILVGELDPVILLGGTLPDEATGAALCAGDDQVWVGAPDGATLPGAVYRIPAPGSVSAATTGLTGGGRYGAVLSCHGRRP